MPKTTLRQARQTLIPYGMVISHKSDEYRVTFRNYCYGGFHEMTRKRQEELAHYTNDIEDAISTGIVMARDYVR